MATELPRVLTFQSPEDFQSRPDWRDDVDVKATPPTKILGAYSFPKAKHLPRGLASCRTPHGLGLVVLLSDDTETNVGHFCGARHVEGATWDRIKTQFDNRRRAENQIDVIQGLLDQRDLVQGEAYDLHQRCVRAAEPVTRIQTPLHKDRVIGRAWDQVKRLDGALTYTRDATARERQYNPAIWTVPESKGRMEKPGLVEPAEILRKLQMSVIDHLEKLNMDKAVALKSKELDRFSKFVSELRDGLRVARVFLVDAERFLRPQNWAAFEAYCRDSGVNFGARGPAIFSEILEVAQTADRSWAEPPRK